MKSLVIFLSFTQITAGILFFILTVVGSNDPLWQMRESGMAPIILIATLAFGIVALILSRWMWTCWLGLLLALVMPVLFVADDLGLGWV